MSLLTAVKSLLRAYPVGPRDAIRLYSAYLQAPLVRILRPDHFRTVGFLIPGTGNLTITIDRIKARIRPHTSDLDIFCLVLEPESFAWFKPKHGETVVDVGAHIGRYALTAAEAGSRVIAVEAEPSNYQLLRENLGLNRFTNVVGFQLALSHTRETEEFYIARKGDTATSSLEPQWRLKVAGPRRSRRVLTETLDHLTQSLGLEHIDWLKIDVEGHEVAVLAGGPSTLARTQNLILEVAQDHEEACKELCTRAGLGLKAVERQIGTRVSNWLLVRNLEVTPLPALQTKTRKNDGAYSSHQRKAVPPG